MERGSGPAGKGDEAVTASPDVDRMAGIAHAVSDIGGRDSMEDEHVLEVESARPLRVLGAVFDGHGGSAVARLAKGRFTTLFREASSSTPETALRRAFAEIHRESIGLEGGAVAAAFLVDHSQVTVANAGDAHIVIVAGGRATRLTEDHRLTNEMERKRVVEAGGEIDEPYVLLPDGRGIMPTRTLGDHEFRRVGVLFEPAVSTRPISPGFLVAACDGLWDVIEVQELPGLLRGASTPEEVAELLAREALEVRATSDNLTILVVRIP